MGRGGGDSRVVMDEIKHFRERREQGEGGGLG